MCPLPLPLPLRPQGHEVRVVTCTNRDRFSGSPSRPFSLASKENQGSEENTVLPSTVLPSLGPQTQHSSTRHGGFGEDDAFAPDAFALVCLRGKYSGKIFKMQPNGVQTTWTIGRSKEADISLAGDDEVSSKHAQIIFEKNQFKLVDIGSTNGTFATTLIAPAAKLAKKKKHTLKVGHLITFGGGCFKWCYYTEAVTIGNTLCPSK